MALEIIHDNLHKLLMIISTKVLWPSWILNSQSLDLQSDMLPSVLWSLLPLHLISHLNFEMTDIQSDLFYFIRKHNMLWILIRGASEALFTSIICCHGEVRKSPTFIYFLI